MRVARGEAQCRPGLGNDYFRAPERALECEIRESLQAPVFEVHSFHSLAPGGAALRRGQFAMALPGHKIFAGITHFFPMCRSAKFRYCSQS